MGFLSFFRKPKSIVSKSKIHNTISIGTSFNHPTLFAGDKPQSGGEFVYMWDRIVSIVSSQLSVVSSCLVLGVAGGTVIQSLRVQYPKANILGVEIDTHIIRAGEIYLGLSENSHTKIEIGDALVFVKKHKKKYDLIVVDVFVGSLNVGGSRSKDFLAQLKRLTNKSGAVVFNSHFQSKHKKEYKEFVQLCSEVFKSAEEIFKYPRNRVLLLR